MSFSPNYLKHLEVLGNVGMTASIRCSINGVEIVPLQFLKAVLPDPGDLGQSTKGNTCIGNVITGSRTAMFKAIYVYNICDHEACFAEVGSQAISYTTGVPAMIGAKQMLAGTGANPASGTWNTDPDAFMADLNVHGLPWQFVELNPGFKLDIIQDIPQGPRPCNSRTFGNWIWGDCPRPVLWWMRSPSSATCRSCSRWRRTAAPKYWRH